MPAMAPRAAWALVVAAGALATWMAGDAAKEGPRELRCSRPCCGISCKINCTWEDPGALSGGPATVRFCRVEPAHDCRSFKAGHSTSLAVLQDRVFVLENSTVFVERPAADGQRKLRSEIRSFVLSRAVQFPRLKESEIGFGRSNGSLRLTWPETHRCILHGDPQRQEKEVRIRPQGADNWAQGNCHPGRNYGIDETEEVLCLLEADISFEVQVRHRLVHWSSPWSPWSAAVAVPRAIARSLKVNVTAGRLQRDGTRNVTLQLERPGPDYGEVHFNLTFDLLPCRECGAEREAQVGGRTSFEAVLSGAAYAISLRATNKAGSAPVSSVLLPAAQEEGPIALNVSLSGPLFTARLRAPFEATAFCFENHTLGETPPETPCEEKELDAGDIYENSGTMQPNQCYRLAVHGVALETGRWSTVGSVHFFHRDAGLEALVRLEVTHVGSGWARVRWEPPATLSTCSGATQNYVLCRCRKDTEETAYYKVNASSREFTFKDLDPQAAYLAGVGVSTGGREGGRCRPNVPFATLSPDSKPTRTALALSFLSLGIFIAFLMAAGGFHFSKKRIQASLWPPLPDPSGAEAVKILPALGQGQVRLVLPLETGVPSEPFLVVEGEGGEEGGPLEKGSPPEEPPASPKEGHPPPEYKSKGLLLLGTPEEEEEEGDRS